MRIPVHTCESIRVLGDGTRVKAVNDESAASLPLQKARWDFVRFEFSQQELHAAFRARCGGGAT